jgi:hypothetical protein
MDELRVGVERARSVLFRRRKGLLGDCYFDGVVVHHRLVCQFGSVLVQRRAISSIGVLFRTNARLIVQRYYFDGIVARVGGVCLSRREDVPATVAWIFRVSRWL